MARIVGNLEPGDEFPHPLGPEPNFSESMYFNFFDPERSLGGFLRLGNRANEGHAERTVCLFLPDGRVLFHFARPPIRGNEVFDAGGLRFEVLEPTERLRTRYQGPALELADPHLMAHPRRAFAESPVKDVVIELEHEAVGPLYGRADDATERERPASEQFARAHYEQHMRVRGTLSVDGRELALRGHGLRDHSWGPRFWQALHRYEWLTLNFGDDLGIMVSIVQRDAEGHDVRRGGMVVRGAEADPVVDATVEADYEPNGLYHRAVRARLRTRGGEALAIEGTVRGFVPLRNRRDGHTTHIGEGMTEWRIADRVGYGLSEFLRQVS